MPTPAFAELVAHLGGDTVGACIGQPYRDAARAATVQPTTHGLLTANDAGAWTAFTDGTSTWVDSPDGAITQATAPVDAGHSSPSTRTRPAVPVAAVSSGRDPTSGPLVSGGGPVELTSTNYSVYWQPSGTYMSARYKDLINGFFAVLGGTDFYGLLQQYYGSNGSVTNQSSFGGTWTDTSPYPAASSLDCLHAGQTSTCIGDDDIQNEVLKAIAANNWSTSDGANFFVYTAQGEVICRINSYCSNNTWCAYHSSFTALGTTLRYGVLPYFGPRNCGGFSVSPTGTPTPTTRSTAPRRSSSTP